MWMQILAAAGYPVLGERFPRDWGATIRAANRRGFFESPLRHGIVPEKSRHPETGANLAPEATRGVAVKVFAAGLARTPLAYVERVIASLRHHREYELSLARLYTMEQANKLARAERRGRSREVLPSRAQPPAALEWWNDNFSLIRDARARGYPLRLISYSAVLRDVRGELGATLGWLGGGALEPAIAAVNGALRTQQVEIGAEAPSGIEPEHEAVFEELYARVDEGQGVDERFMGRMQAVHDQLAPRIAAALKSVREERRRARQRARRALGKE